MERDLSVLLKEAAPRPRRPPAPEAARRRAGRIRGVRRALGGVVTLAVVAAGVMVVPVLLTERADTFLAPGAGRVQVSIFLSDAINSFEVAEIDAELAAEPTVISYYYEAESDSYAFFRDRFSDDPALLESVDEDAFPAAFRALVTDEAAARQLEERISGMRGIDDIVVAPAARADQGNPPEGFGFPVSGRLVEDASWLLDLDDQSAARLGRWRAYVRPIEGAKVECLDGSAVQRERVRAGWAVQAHVLGVEDMQPPSLPSSEVTVACP